MDRSKSNRRDFLKGKSAVRAIQAVVDGDIKEIPVPISECHSLNRQNAYLEYYTKNAMACEFAIMFNMHQSTMSGAAAALSFELIDRLEDQLSIYRPQSELSELNLTASEQPVQVEQGLFQVLQIANEIHADTSGHFDVSSSPLSEIWGFMKREGKVPDENEIQTALAKVDASQIELDEQNTSVKFLAPSISINLGGIGKGYALDRVAKLIESKGISDFVIHGGQSSVVARGSQVVRDPSQSTSKDAGIDSTDEGWNVGLSHPLIPDQRIAQFRLSNEALGTSGSGRQGFFFKGKRYGHIINPRTGWPTDHILSSTVIAPSAAVSDALATAFFTMPIPAIEDYCRLHPDVKAVLVCDCGRSGKTELIWFNISDTEWTRF